MSDPRVFQGSICQKYPQFCTTAENDASHGCSIQKDMVNVTFSDKDGEEKNIKVPVGMSMLEAVHENDIELEGACEGSLACSTCHVIKITWPELDGVRLAFPAATRDFAVDGYVPKPH
ncbi:hypothetical protein CISIN_1g041173mg [Citrus sinensis]|uniref:2Fe-2S ferredoxin-type domain-containing protein n=1 Tax=Citrus sinensis TaxID=2711 RepID=A0A067DLH5_CITSI|nr:hypothetical protein CISIN_1g041173mg [Citrus sinensis]